VQPSLGSDVCSEMEDSGPEATLPAGQGEDMHVKSTVEGKGMASPWS
jgi:hypothetical protein